MTDETRTDGTLDRRVFLKTIAMVSTVLTAWCLLALTVTIHAAGLSMMLYG
jgi:hypothetical protein